MRFTILSCGSALFVSAFAGLCLSTGVMGAELSLKEAILESLANSPVLRQQAFKSEEARYRSSEAFAGHLPTVALQGNYLNAKTSMKSDMKLPGASSAVSIDQVVPTSMVTLNASWPLFDGLATTHRVSASEQMAESSAKELEWARFQLERQVTLQYFRTIASRQLYDVTMQNRKTLDDHLKDVRLFRSAGLATTYDVLRVETQASEAQSEVLNAQDNVAQAQDALAELMGKDQEPRTASGLLPVIQKSKIPELTAPPKSTRKDLEALENTLSGMDEQLAAARGHWAPKLSLVGQYSYYNNRNDKPMDMAAYRNFYQAGLGLTWVLFDGLASTERVHEVVSQRAQVEQTIAQRRLKARHEDEFWRRKLDYFLALYQTRVSDIAKAQESVRLAQAGQKAGTRTNSDLLDAESELFRAKAGAVNAQMGTIEAMVNLEVARGEALINLASMN